MKKRTYIIIIIDILFALIYLFTIFSKEIFGFSIRFWLANAVSIGFIIIANSSFIYYLLVTRCKTFSKEIYRIISIIGKFCIGFVIFSLSIVYILVLVTSSKYAKEYIVIEDDKKYIIYEDPFFSRESKYEYGNIFFRGKEVYINKEITTKE